MYATGTARFGKVTPSPICAPLCSLAAASSRGVSLCWTVHRCEPLDWTCDMTNFSFILHSREKHAEKAPTFVSACQIHPVKWQIQAGASRFYSLLRPVSKFVSHLLKKKLKTVQPRLCAHSERLCTILTSVQNVSHPHPMFMKWLSHRVVEGMVVELLV